MWFLMIDAYSNWPEIVKMSSTATEATTSALKDAFARHGLPETLVTDNGRRFTSSEFANFCAMRGIKHLTIAPNRPQSNGLAERLVQSFKAGRRR